MLYKETVAAETLELLKTLMNDPLMDKFFLVGGTALSLQIGHRISIDLDLFSLENFPEENLLADLENQYHYQLAYEANNTLKGQIGTVAVDLITHSYPLLNELNEIEGVRMASLKDIAAMKLNAIVNSGSRLKDFIDVAFLSAHLSLNDMVDAYGAKYSSRNPLIALKALEYHSDIDFNEPVKMLEGNYPWYIISNRLSEMRNDPHSVLTELQPELNLSQDASRGRRRKR